MVILQGKFWFISVDAYLQPHPCSIFFSSFSIPQPQPQQLHGSQWHGEQWQHLQFPVVVQLQLVFVFIFC